LLPKSAIPGSAGPARSLKPLGSFGFLGRGGPIRTGDPLLPKQMRYQTAPRPARRNVGASPRARKAAGKPVPQPRVCARRPVGDCWRAPLRSQPRPWARQNIRAPPLGLRHWPVMNVAPGPARNTATFAISSGRPSRPSGICASLARVSGDVEPPVSRGVSVGPGAMALTRMRGANSRARNASWRGCRPSMRNRPSSSRGRDRRARRRC
jgi:hypothetical protein